PARGQRQCVDPGPRCMQPDVVHACDLTYNAPMADIDIQHPHSLPQPAAREAVEQAITRLGEKFGLDYRWEGETLHFRRSGVDGRIALQPGAVHVSATLGMLSWAMKGATGPGRRRRLQDRLPWPRSSPRQPPWLRRAWPAPSSSPASGCRAS